MPMRRQMQNKGELAVMVVCVVVGFLLAAQLRSVKLAGAADATNASRLETLQNLYNEVVDQKDGLADQVKQLQGELELYREQAASGEAGSQALKAELEQLEITAGLTDVEGPGVTIILEDSSQANVTGNEADYLIHDNDLLSVINELRSAGAEAISLNGERILGHQRGALHWRGGNGERAAVRRALRGLCHRRSGHPLQCADHAQRRGGRAQPVGHHREGHCQRPAAHSEIQRHRGVPVRQAHPGG